jgi:voltage-gated potassium channel
MRMAETLIRPKLVGFLSKIAGHTTADLDFDTLRVPGKSELVGQSLKNSRISQETRVNLIAVRRREGEMNFNPGPEFIIQAEDHLYALGHKDQVNSLRKFVDSA